VDGVGGVVVFVVVVVEVEDKSRTASSDASMALTDLYGGVEGVAVMKGWEWVYLQFLVRWRGLAAPRGRIISGDVLFRRRFRIGVGAGLFLGHVFRRREALACVGLLSLLEHLGGGGVVVLVLELGFEGW
jgi:hypothetical protein